MNKWPAMLLSFFLAGCTTMGDPYTAPPPAPEGKSLVYFMRTSVGFGNFWPTVFSVNGNSIVSLYDKGYSWIHLDSGTHKFSAGTVLNSDYLKFTMPVTSGEEYFIEFTQHSVGNQMVRNVVRSVPAGVGKRLVEKYSYKQADETAVQSKPVGPSPSQ